jgi:hypothetical protein
VVVTSLHLAGYQVDNAGLFFKRHRYSDEQQIRGFTNAVLDTIDKNTTSIIIIKLVLGLVLTTLHLRGKDELAETWLVDIADFVIVQSLTDDGQ